MRKETGIAIFIFKMKKIDIFGDELTYQSHSVINLWVKAGWQTLDSAPCISLSLMAFHPAGTCQLQNRIVWVSVALFVRIESAEFTLETMKYLSPYSFA